MGVLTEPRLELLAQALASGKTVIEASKAGGSAAFSGVYRNRCGRHKSRTGHTNFVAFATP
jgi:hypothetical protein